MREAEGERARGNKNAGKQLCVSIAGPSDGGLCQDSQEQSPIPRPPESASRMEATKT